MMKTNGINIQNYMYVKAYYEKVLFDNFMCLFNCLQSVVKCINLENGPDKGHDIILLIVKLLIQLFDSIQKDDNMTYHDLKQLIDDIIKKSTENISNKCFPLLESLMSQCSSSYFTGTDRIVSDFKNKKVIFNDELTGYTLIASSENDMKDTTDHVKDHTDDNYIPVISETKNAVCWCFHKLGMYIPRSIKCKLAIVDNMCQYIIPMGLGTSLVSMIMRISLNRLGYTTCLPYLDSAVNISNTASAYSGQYRTVFNAYDVLSIKSDNPDVLKKQQKLLGQMGTDVYSYVSHEYKKEITDEKKQDVAIVRKTLEKIESDADRKQNAIDLIRTLIKDTQQLILDFAVLQNEYKELEKPLYPYGLLRNNPESVNYKKREQIKRTIKTNLAKILDTVKEFDPESSVYAETINFIKYVNNYNDVLNLGLNNEYVNVSEEDKKWSDMILDKLHLLFPGIITQSKKKIIQEWNPVSNISDITMAHVSLTTGTFLATYRLDSGLVKALKSTKLNIRSLLVDKGIITSTVTAQTIKKHRLTNEDMKKKIFDTIHSFKVEKRTGRAGLTANLVAIAVNSYMYSNIVQKATKSLFDYADPDSKSDEISVDVAGNLNNMYPDTSHGTKLIQVIQYAEPFDNNPLSIKEFSGSSSSINAEKEINRIVGNNPKNFDIQIVDLFSEKEKKPYQAWIVKPNTYIEASNTVSVSNNEKDSEDNDEDDAYADY